MLKQLIERDLNRQHALAEAYVVPDSVRCVQCGICSYNCPIGLDIRAHASEGLTISASRCLTCGECVARCPRRVLTLQRTPLFR